MAGENTEKTVRPPTPSERRKQLEDALKAQTDQMRKDLLLKIIESVPSPTPKRSSLMGDYLKSYDALAKEREEMVDDLKRQHRKKELSNDRMNELIDEVKKFRKEVEDFNAECALREDFHKNVKSANNRIAADLPKPMQTALLQLASMVRSLQEKLDAGKKIPLEHLRLLKELYPRLLRLYERKIPDLPEDQKDVYKVVGMRLTTKRGGLATAIVEALGNGTADANATFKSLAGKKDALLGLIAEYEKTDDLYAKNVKLLKDKPAEYKERTQKLMGKYKQSWKLNTLTDTEFVREIESLRGALKPPPGPKDPEYKKFKEGDIKILTRIYEDLKKAIPLFFVQFNVDLFMLETQGKVDDESAEAQLKEFVTLMIRRYNYEQLREPVEKRKHNSNLLAYLGIFSEAIADNYAMGGASGETVSLFTVRREFIQLPAAAQEALLRELTKSLSNQGCIVLEDASMYLSNKGALKQLVDTIKKTKTPIVLGHANSAASIQELRTVLKSLGIAEERIIQGLEGLETLGVAERNLLLKGIKEAEKMLGKAVTAEEFAALLKQVKMEGGLRALGKDIFHVPLTPGMWVLFAIFFHQTDNKVEAAMLMASFLIAGNAFDAIVIERLFGKAVPYLVSLGSVAKAEQYMLAFKGVPPIVKLTLVLAVCFAGEKYIVNFVKWADKQITESQGKFAADMVLRVLFFDNVFTLLDMALLESGARNVNPEKDWMRTMAKETITLKGTDYYINTGNWNAYVDKAIKNERSEVKKNKWAFEKIDAAWQMRQSVMLYAQVSLMRNIKKAIGETVKDGKIKEYDEKTQKMVDKDAPDAVKLKKTVTADQVNDALACILDIATLDGKNRYERNDRELTWTLAGSWANGKLDARAKDVAAVKKAMEGLDEKDPLRMQWDNYVATAQSTAKMVSVLQHMKFSDKSGDKEVLKPLYDREKMLGEEGDKGYPEYVKKGLVEKIKYNVALARADDLVNVKRLNKAVEGKMLPSIGSANNKVPENGFDPRLGDR